MHFAYFTQYFLLIVIGSVMLILITKAKPFKNRVVNLYATSVLPIYLITENTAFSHFMWAKHFKCGSISNLFILLYNCYRCYHCSLFDMFNI